MTSRDHKAEVMRLFQIAEVNRSKKKEPEINLPWGRKRTW